MAAASLRDQVAHGDGPHRSGMTPDRSTGEAGAAPDE